MDILYSALVFLHMLGMAGILAGWLMQVATSSDKAPKALLHSAWLQLVVGVAMVAFLEIGLVDSDGAINHAKIGVKLAVALAVLVFAILNTRKPSTRLASAAGALAVVNVAVAVFW